VLAIENHNITQLKGVGDKVAQRLQKLNIYTIEDLIFHLPKRYQDRTRITPIAHLTVGQHVSIEATIISASVIQGRRPMLCVQVQDDSGQATLRFFHFSMQQHQSFQRGRRLRAFGEVRYGHQGLELIHPEYHLDTDTQPLPLEAYLTPIYATTDGLKQLSLRKLIEQALTWLTINPLPELLPKGAQPHALSLQEALMLLHQPPADMSISLLEARRHPAQQRLIIEELLAHSLSLRKLKQKNTQQQAYPMPDQAQAQQLIDTFLSQLPFSMTQAQQRVCTEIQQDLTQSYPMMRLVQGDVGSGKTLVGAVAALCAISQGYQIAFLAPTELLAEQHLFNFSKWFTPLEIEVAWLSGKLKGKARQHTLDAIAQGQAKLIVGTHAIFQEAVIYHNLALIIIDEQHRFGVQQRLSLKKKGDSLAYQPHQLIMTATPIPRTLAMTAYANLDTSVIDELPPGRTPITTVAIPETRRDAILQRIQNAVSQDKRQVYWVCTLIETSDVLECQAAEDTAMMLSEQLQGLTVGLVHGRMNSQDKQRTMDQFKQGKIDLLVATTVIEVGVDVPNASLMIIENPERLGLAQLHQLRGRVGRGSIESHCVLLYKSPLSQQAQQRLNILRESNDGFIIAQRDLELRGPGEVFGLKQTGALEMRVASLTHDHLYIDQVKQLADYVCQHAPEQSAALIKRWLGMKHIYHQS